MTGRLWASVECRERAIVRNIAPGGALIELRLPGVWQSVRVFDVWLNESGPPLTAVMRHLTPLTDAPGEDRFVVGVEFGTLSAEAHAALDQFMSAWTDHWN